MVNLWRLSSPGKLCVCCRCHSSANFVHTQYIHTTGGANFSSPGNDKIINFQPKKKNKKTLNQFLYNLMKLLKTIASNLQIQGWLALGAMPLCLMGKPIWTLLSCLIQPVFRQPTCLAGRNNLRHMTTSIMLLW